MCFGAPGGSFGVPGGGVGAVSGKPPSRLLEAKSGSQLGQKRKVGSQLKRFSRDSQESLEVQKGLFLLICLLFLLVFILVCLFAMISWLSILIVVA